MIARGEIGATSLTTPTFLWLHEEAWDDEQKAFFEQDREAPYVGLYAPAAPMRSRKGRSAVPLTRRFGRWLLTLPNGTVVASAEAHLVQGSFTSLRLEISAVRQGSWQDDPARSALILLLSALFLLADADQLRLVPLRLDIAPQLAALNLGGEQRTLWSPYKSLARLAGAPDLYKVQSTLLDPHEWWQLPFAADARKTLSYLERRLAIADKPGPTPRRRRRPWWRLW